MVRNYVRKKPPAAYTGEDIVAALVDVRGGSTFRQASRRTEGQDPDFVIRRPNINIDKIAIWQ